LKLFKKSLALSLSFWLSLVLIVVFTVMALSNLIYQSQLMKNREEEAAVTLATTILGAIRFPMLEGNQDVIQRQLVMIKEANPELVIHLLDHEGIIRRSTQPDLMGKKSEAVGLDRALGGEEIRAVEFRKRVGYRVYEELRPILNERLCFACHGSKRKVLGVLRIAKDFRPLERALVQSRNQNIIFSILGLIIAIALLYFSTRRTLKPIAILVEVAKGVAAGDLSQKIEFDSDDEIGIVGQSFNSIIASFRNIISNVSNMTEKVIDAAQHFSANTQ